MCIQPHICDHSFVDQSTPPPLIQIREMYIHSEPYHTYSIHFLLDGLPQDDPINFVDASMSVPVLPAVDHPLSRPPLRPNNPLPWNNCYLSPFTTATVRCPTLFTESPVDCELDEDEWMRYNDLITEDLAKRDAVRSEPQEVPAKAGDSEQDPAMLNMVDRSNDVTKIQIFNAPVTVTVSHDLSSVKEPNDPKGFFEEVESIKRSAL